MDAATDVLSVAQAAFELKLPTPLRADLSANLTRQIEEAVDMVEQNTRRVLVDRTVAYPTPAPCDRRDPVQLVQSDIRSVSLVRYWVRSGPHSDRGNDAGLMMHDSGRLTPLRVDGPRMGYWLWPAAGGWPEAAVDLEVSVLCGMTAATAGAALGTARRAVVLALHDLYGGYPTPSRAYEILCNRLRRLYHSATAYQSAHYAA